MTTPQAIPIAPQQSSSQAAADSTRQTVSHLSREANEIGHLVAQGEWSELLTRLYVGGLDFAVEQLLPAIIVFVLLYLLLRGVGRLLDRMFERSDRVEYGLRSLLMRTYRVAGLVLLTTIVLSQLGINVTALFAGLSVIGIAVGFAARDSMENFIAGVTVLIDQPFQVGDNIEVEGTFGTVEEITLRSTRVRTLDSQIAILPNTQMITEKLINHTKLSTVRVVVKFGIAYKEHPQEAREVVLALTEDDERLHPDYDPKVVVTEMAGSSVNMELRLFLRNPKLEVPVRLDYTENVREALREANIEIPFPHLQLFVDEASAFDESFLMKPEVPLLSSGDGGSGKHRSNPDG
ncbi:MAG: mechanosensitive ion channel family protein [Bacteroidetes bacterium QS_1_65_9]|jgi:small conductance mechanosensitive channel|nr:MAG: mechanosensitive ion channel family protein [Bacteroidetes bacterium QS_1_65_9]